MAVVLRLSLLLILACAAGCRPATDAEPPESVARPDVLLVVVDTLRPDFLGTYGFPHATSPNLDALAAKGVVFERALAASAMTAPSHASIMTSRFVNEHSIGAVNGGSRLDGEVTLAQRFREAGYDTAAFIGNVVIGRATGLDAGFDVYDDRLPDVERNRGVVFERTAEKTTERAVAWLAGRGERPFFLWVHYQDPHGPYTPPPPLDAAFPELESADEAALPVLGSNLGRHGIPAYQALAGLRRPSAYRRRYAGEIAFFDASLGRLLEASRRPGRERVVAFTADHGESMGEGGFYFTHGHATTPDVARVPLVLVAPGLPPARRSELVHHVDLLPTLLELAGLPPLEASRGLALGPLLRGGKPIPERVLFTDAGHDVAAYRGGSFVREWTEHGARESERGRFRWGPGSEWRWGGPADAELEARLDDYASRHVEPVPVVRGLDGDQARRLRALGYLEHEP